MSVEKITDSINLFEYDEFDAYEGHTYQFKCNGLPEGGIPLSIELSESLCKSQTTVNEKPFNFVRAPEIFLRIDSTSTTELSPEILDQNYYNPSGLKHGAKINRLESTKTNDVILFGSQDECVELQYENEFLCPNDDSNNDFTLSTRNQHDSIDNDYEEVLFEGILQNRKNCIVIFSNISANKSKRIRF